jgi:hypothetical protein
MPRNNQKNGAKSNSNVFELLSEVEDGTNEDEIPSSAPARTSTRGRPLKRMQPCNPELLLLYTAFDQYSAVEISLKEISIDNGEL